MFTRNLRTINSDIGDKELAKLKCKYRSEFSNQVILENLKKDHYEIMKMKAWLKTSGWYDWTIWKPVFNMLDQTPVERIYLTNYRNPDIIFDIVHVKFPKLRELHLEDNLMISIEPIVALKIPNLRKLDIRRNLILSIQCLKRCEFPRLEELCLSDNFIFSCVCISECYFPEMKRLIIEEKSQPNIYMQYEQGRGQRQLKATSSVNGYDLRWIIKLETSTMEFISNLLFKKEYSSDERIIRRELEEQIGMKFYKVRVEKRGMDMGSLLPLMAF